MKRITSIKMLAALALCALTQTSCLQEPNMNIKSELELPSGAVDYFTNSMDFGYEGGSKQLAFKLNVKWDMKIANTQNGVQWLTIDPMRGNSGSNKVVFTTEENNTYEDRSVTVQLNTGDTIRNIRVNQKRLKAITLTSDVYQVAAAGGTINVGLNHSMDYDIIIPDDYKSWIHLASSSANTRSQLEATSIAFTIDPSEEYEKREGKIYFTAGGEEEVVTVYQAGEGQLILSQNEYNLNSDEQEFTIDINSNFDFSIQMPDVDWLQASAALTRGMSSHTLRFKVTKNDDYKSRTAKIKIYDNNSKLSEEIVVNQASIGAVLTLGQKQYFVSNDKQELDIDVKSNFDFTLDFQGANWVRQIKSATRGITSRLLKLSIDENKTNDARTANIKLYDKNSTAAEVITITQSAKSGIEVTTKLFTIDELGGIIIVKINANTDYQIKSNNDWIKAAAQTRGLTAHEHRFTVAPLDDTEDRDGTITVSNDALKYKETITVKQRNTFYLETKSMDILIGKEKALSLKNTTKQNVVWSSSNTAIATVSENGFVKGISRGSATIVAKTADGQHIATCKVNICEISDMISIKSGGTVSKEGNVVKSGSQIKWAIRNNSPVKITLKSMQLKGSGANEQGNEYYANEDIAAGSSVTKTTKIDATGGYHLPITCHFIFVYDGKDKEYEIDAKYE